MQKSKLLEAVELLHQANELGYQTLRRYQAHGCPDLAPPQIVPDPQFSKQPLGPVHQPEDHAKLSRAASMSRKSQSKQRVVQKG